MLTGNKNVDFIIMNKLDDNSLFNLCLTSKKFKSIFYDDHFWMNRTLINFPYVSIDILKNSKGNIRWSKYYIELKTINVSDAKDFLYIGSLVGRLDYVSIAIEKGANIYHNNNYAIKLASEYGHLEVVKYLIKQGAYVLDESISYACKNGHSEIVNYLLDLRYD